MAEKLKFYSTSYGEAVRVMRMWADDDNGHLWLHSARTHAFTDVTTRTHYPCTREIAILVNGVAQARRRLAVEKGTKIARRKEIENRKKNR